MKKISLLICLLSLTACTTTLPTHATFTKDYNLSNVKTADVKMDCENAQLDNVDPESIKDYCQMLLASVKTNLRSRADFKITETEPDIGVKVKLEEAYGGNAHARFWVGMGAGKSAITTLTTITKAGKEIAQGRIVETSTMPNMAVGTWSNESMILQDIGIIGKKIADFIISPSDFVEKPATN